MSPVGLGCVVLNYNDSENTEELAELLSQYSVVSEVVVVDNRSTDDSLKRLRAIENPKITLIQSENNSGYGAGNNIGVRFLAEEGKCEYALIINPDVRVTESCLSGLLALFAEDNMVAAVSCKQYLGDGSEAAFSAWNFPVKRDLVLSPIYRKSSYQRVNEDGAFSTMPVDCVAGAMLMVRISAFLEAGCYDEEVFLFSEEMILGKRFASLGYKTLYAPAFSYDHFHSTSVSKAYEKQTKRLGILFSSRAVLLRKYYKASSFEMAMYRLSWRARLLAERIAKR